MTLPIIGLRGPNPRTTNRIALIYTVNPNILEIIAQTLNYFVDIQAQAGALKMLSFRIGKSLKDALQIIDAKKTFLLLLFFIKTHLLTCFIFEIFLFSSGHNF